MSNLLNEIFSQDEPEYKGTLTFEDAAARAEFLKALDRSNEEEQPIEIKGIKNLANYIETKHGKHLYDSHAGEIIQFYVFPSFEARPFEVDTDYGKYTFDFKQIKKNNNDIVTKNDENAIVHIQIITNQSEPEISFMYKLNPMGADSVETIVKSYNALRKLIERFMKVDIDDEVGRAFTSLSQLEAYWTRVRQVEKALGINFDPSRITDSNKDEGDIELIYLLIIKRLPIRYTIKGFTVKMKYSDSFDKESFGVGRQIAPPGVNGKISFSVYGEAFTIYTKTYFFNSVIDAIEDDINKKEYTVMCIGTETKPLYAVYFGYAVPDEVPAAEGFNGIHEKYAGAKTFNETMDALNEEYHSPIRMN